MAQFDPQQVYIGISGALLNRIMTLLESQGVIAGDGVETRDVPGGKVVRSTGSGAGAGVGHPWMVRRADGGVTVQLGGFVCGETIVPQIDAVDMSADYNENFIAVTAATAGNILLEVTVDDTSPYAIVASAVDVIWQAGAIPDNTLTTRYVWIAAIADTGEIAQVTRFSLFAARAGDPEEVDNLRWWANG